MTRKMLNVFGLLALIALGAAGGLVPARSGLAGGTSVAALATQTHFHGIAVDARDADRVYLATHHGLFAAGPDGTAERISERRDDFMGFTPHPSDPDVLYASGHPAGGGNLGLIVSRDGGRTWRTVGQGAHGPSDFHQMTISPVDPGVIYGIYGTDFQASRDGGRTWNVVSQIPDRIFGLAASAQTANGVYAASAGGLLHSADGGRSWTQLTGMDNPVTMVATGAEARVFIFVAGKGLLQAAAPDFEWRLLSNGFGGEFVLHFAVARSDARRMYAVTVDPSTRSQAVVASRDGGMSWAPLGPR